MRSVILAAFAATSLFLGVSCASDPQPSTPASAKPAESAAPVASAEPEAKLQIEDVVVGTKGPAAKKGSAVEVHYTGRLVDGTVFDSSVERGQPFKFILGNGTVIKGWDEGLVGMRAGGKRKLTIPPDLGYGDLGSPPTIPGHATLVFDVEMLYVVE